MAPVPPLVNRYSDPLISCSHKVWPTVFKVVFPKRVVLPDVFVEKVKNARPALALVVKAANAALFPTWTVLLRVTLL